MVPAKTRRRCFCVSIDCIYVYEEGWLWVVALLRLHADDDAVRTSKLIIDA